MGSLNEFEQQHNHQFVERHIGYCEIGDGQQERRNSFRHTWATFVQVCWLTEHDLSAPVFLETSDLSNGGLGLLTRSMVHPGSIGVALLVDNTANYQIRWFVVKYCRYDTWLADHVVGCQWISQPPGMKHIDVKMTDRGYRMVPGRSRKERRRRRPEP